MKKSGTPTMGGVAFLIAVSVALSFICFTLIGGDGRETVISVLLCQAYAISNSLIGIIDDFKKLRKKRKRGRMLNMNTVNEMVIYI